MENQSYYQILLAEDNVFNQKVATAMLKKLGVTVDVAANGQEVIDKLQKASYTLILMDCEMPVMSGYEATEKIRQIERDSEQHIPIIAMTAHGSSEDRSQCLRLGMDDYISKPFRMDTLQELLARWQVKLTL